MDDMRKTKAQLVRELKEMRVELARVRATRVRGEITDGVEAYHTLFEAALDGIVVADWAGQILAANRRALELTGHQEVAALIGTNLFEPVPESDQTHFFDRLRLSARHRSSDPIEIEFHRVDDSTFSAEVRGYAIRDDEDVPRAFVAIIRDITERKEMERKLRLTRFAVDHAADAIAVTDADGRFIFVNDTACRSTGYTRDQHRSLTVREINPHLDGRAWRKLWRDLRRSGELRIETEHRAADGALFPVELTLSHLEYEGEEYSCAVVRDTRQKTLKPDR